MGIDFSGIRTRLRLRLERFNVRVRLALLHFLHRVTIKLGSQDQKEQFSAEWEAHERATDEKRKSVHREALFRSVGLALSSWAGTEDLLIAIASLLLSQHEGAKAGIILYSITNHNIWLSIIGDLFSQEPRYLALKPRWNKLSDRLKGLNDTRVRLAHHTVYYGDNDATLSGDISLRPGQFDVRPKSQKHRSEPLDNDQLFEFIDSTNKLISDLRELLTSMTEILLRETSQQKSSQSTTDQPHP